MHMNRRHLLLTAAMAPMAGFARAGTGDPVLVTTNGPVRGLVQDGINVFRGVRYGADTATTRFARPKRPVPWTEVQSATGYGASAPQRGGDDRQSEDCLFLNVWTPGLGDGGLRHTEIVRLLLAHGADIRIADKQGVTPLAHAEQRGQHAISALLRVAAEQQKKAR